MAETEPWISFHAPWTQRAKSGMVLYDRIHRFLAAVAVDPAPDSLELRIDGERHGEQLPPLVAEATAVFGPAAVKASSTGALARWSWERRAPPALDATPFVEFFRAHEGAVQLMINYWFEVKRPGESALLFPGATLRSSVMIWLDSRHANLSLRYQSPDFTPALRAAHADIVAALGPKTPRHALQRIIPARTPGGRERREPITP